jgi:predicted Fe-Mo cluster-binding NifX family protein
MCPAFWSDQKVDSRDQGLASLRSMQIAESELFCIVDSRNGRGFSVETHSLMLMLGQVC